MNAGMRRGMFDSFIHQDDQDVALGGFKPMSKTSALLAKHGTTAKNWSFLCDFVSFRFMS